MTKLTVAALQLAFTDDTVANIRAVSELVREAAGKGAEVVLPPELFEGPYFAGPSGRLYDVARDGQRFLMIKESGVGDQGAGATPASMVVIVNWIEELRQRVPTR